MGFSMRRTPKGGSVIASLFDDPRRFLLTPVQVEVFDPAAGEHWIEGVPPGRYALLVHHDRNGDGELNRNFLGIPTEPVAFSSGYRPRARPLFERASFDLGADERRLFEVELDPLLGTTGRFGVGVGGVAWRSPYRGDGGTTERVFPAITYVGDRLQVLGPQVRYGIYDRPFLDGDLRVATTARFRFGPYEEDDSSALAGLGDREDTVMVGLSVTSDLPGGLRWTASYERDALGEIGGGGGRFELARQFPVGSVRWTPFVGLNWLEKELSRHDYGVPASAAQPGRPAHDPGDTLGIEAGVGVYWELSERWALVGNLSIERLDDDIVDSPIVSRDELVRGFFSVVYSF